METQSLSTKRAQVEFHNFASLGEPERAFKVYAEENERRGALIRRHLNFIGPMTPFLEIGANAGHTSYMLANEFGADGFALDISADSLRHGIALQDRWKMPRAPVRVAGDGANLPFADNSIRFIMTHQTLSQFMNLDSIFDEVVRVLAPGGVFFFSEEPLLRTASLRLFRVPYYGTMKPWERKLFDWGLLGYLTKDVIGAEQEESFGIRQNHTMGLKDWDRLVKRYFVEREYNIFVPERGWGERWAKKLAIRLDPYGSEWRAARLLGGTLAAVCRKAGEAVCCEFSLDRFESALRCPDCHAGLFRDGSETLKCAACGYEAANADGVHNLLPSVDRRELYPGARADVIDFSQPAHAELLLDGWYELEGVFGNKYRWIGASASARLTRVQDGPQRIRIRGHAQDALFAQGRPVTLEVRANGAVAGRWTLERTGLFVLEADLPEAADYVVDIAASPVWQAPGDLRSFTVNLSLIRLVPRESR